MNDTVREYLSYGKFVLPLARFKRTVKPEEVIWGDRDQYFLYFKSPAPKENKLVIYLHGGGWNSNSPKQHDFVGVTIARNGYDCVMLGYRKVPKVRYEGIVEDVFTGYEKLRAFFKERGIRYDKTVVCGSSAGAHLGALLCFDTKMQEQYSVRADDFDGLVLMAGPVDFSHPQTGSINWLLRGLFGTKDRKIWEKGEPIRKMTTLKNFKVCVIQSRHDGLVGYEQAKAFYEKAKALRMDAEFYDVTDKWNTHSAYCVGVFLVDPTRSNTLAKTLEMIEKI